MDISHELHRMFLEVQKYTEDGPNEIIVSKAAMNDVLMDIGKTNDFLLCFNTDNGVIGTYYGVPLKIYDGGDEKKIIVTGERDLFRTQYLGRPFTPCEYDNPYQYYYQDTMDYYDYRQRFAIVSGFDNTVTTETQKVNDDITDEQLVTLLNGGGYHAVV